MSNDRARCSLVALQWVLGLVILVEAALFAFSSGSADTFARTGLPDFIRMVLAWGEMVAAVLFLIPRTLVGGGWLLIGPTIRAGSDSGRIVSSRRSHPRGVRLSLAVPGTRSIAKVLGCVAAVCKRAGEASSLSRDHHLGIFVSDSRADGACQPPADVGRIHRPKSRSSDLGKRGEWHSRPVLSARDTCLGQCASRIPAPGQGC